MSRPLYLALRVLAAEMVQIPDVTTVPGIQEVRYEGKLCPWVTWSLSQAVGKGRLLSSWQPCDPTPFFVLHQHPPVVKLNLKARSEV